MGEYMENIKTSEFEKEVVQSDKTVLVKFYADWCGPCKALNPVVEELEQELGDAVKIFKVDVDSEHELASKYGIRGIPTMIFFEKGQVKSTLVGLQSKEEIKKHLE